jgi:multiple sugar transport system permease protein
MVGDAGTILPETRPVGHPTDRAWWRRRDALWLLAPAVLYLIVFSVFPFLYSLWASFNDWDKRALSFTFIGLGNYQELLTDDLFWASLGATALMVVAAVALQLVAGTALAIFFSRPMRGAWLVRGMIIFPMLLTPVVVGLMWRALLNPEWGVVDWILGSVGLPQPNWLGDLDLSIWTLILIDSWQWTPFVFVIVFARLQSLPQDIFESASVDGSSRRDRLRYITLPLLAPAIALAGVFRAIDAFRSFDLVFGLTYGGPGRSTATLSFLVFQNGFQYQLYGYASAMGYVMVIILVVATTILFRFVHLRRGDVS